MNILVITPFLAQYKLQFWESIARVRPEWNVVIASESNSLASRKSWVLLSSDDVEVVYFNSVERSSEFSDYNFKVDSRLHLVDFMRGRKFDVIVFNNLKQLLKFRIFDLFRNRFIFVVEEDFEFFSNSSFVRKIFFSFSRRFISGYITLTKGAEHLLQVLGVPQKNVAHCNWVLRSNILSEVSSSSVDIMYDFIFVGQFNKRKGLDKLLELIPGCIALDSNLTFLIAGTGEFEDQVLSLADKFPNNVFVLLDVPSPDVPKLLLASSCLLLLSREDIFGMVVLEAFEHMRPVIVTPGARSSSYVDNLSLGVVLPETDLLTPKDLVEALPIAISRFNENISNIEYFSDVARSEEFASKIDGVFLG